VLQGGWPMVRSSAGLPRVGGKATSSGRRGHTRGGGAVVLPARAVVLPERASLLLTSGWGTAMCASGGEGRFFRFIFCIHAGALTQSDGGYHPHRTAANPGDREFDPPGDAEHCPNHKPNPHRTRYTVCTGFNWFLD
jgi:hypothetical protein